MAPCSKKKMKRPNLDTGNLWITWRRFRPVLLMQSQDVHDVPASYAEMKKIFNVHVRHSVTSPVPLQITWQSTKTKQETADDVPLSWAVRYEFRDWSRLQLTAVINPELSWTPPARVVLNIYTSKAKAHEKQLKKKQPKMFGRPAIVEPHGHGFTSHDVSW